MGGSPKSSIKKRIVRLSIEIQPFIHFIDGLSIINHPFDPFVHRIVHEINHPAIGDPPFMEPPIEMGNRSLIQKSRFRENLLGHFHRKEGKSKNNCHLVLCFIIPVDSI
jgi:hypothetical protein